MDIGLCHFMSMQSQFILFAVSTIFVVFERIKVFSKDALNWSKETAKHL